jgi:hypothetical protein
MSEELMAVIDVMAYGYEVSVSINGCDIGINGGKSESKRLLGQDDPMASSLPSDMKNLACLKSGENELKIAYKRLTDEDFGPMTIEVKSAAQFENDEHAFLLREDTNDIREPKNAGGTFSL